MRHPEEIDGAALAKLEGIGGRELVHRMIELFLKNAGRRVDAARAGARAGDREAVRYAAHALKSSAAIVGAWRVQELSERLESRSLPVEASEIPGLVADLGDALDRAIVRLREEMECDG